MPNNKVTVEPSQNKESDAKLHAVTAVIVVMHSSLFLVGNQESEEVEDCNRERVLIILYAPKHAQGQGHLPVTREPGRQAGKQATYLSCQMTTQEETSSQSIECE